MKKPPDPRHNKFFELAYEAYRLKHKQVPHWNGKDGRQLASLLRGDIHLTSGEFCLRWGEYESTRDQFHAKQGDSLAYFCANFDKFMHPAEVEEPEFIKTLREAKRKSA
jgi:hypothetical protein